jgi:uncharacterized protein YkwD
MYRAARSATRRLNDPPPAEDAEEGATTGPDSVVATLNLEHEIVTTTAGLFDANSQGVVDGLTYAQVEASWRRSPRPSVAASSPIPSRGGMLRVRLGRFLAMSLAVVAALPGTASAATDCSAGPPPETATLCRLNAARAAYGLPAVRADARLARVARAHSLDMVAHQYFAHDSRSGASFASRLLGADWMRGRRRWTVGENLAWGTGPRAAPAFVVAAWLRSPPHRRVMLHPGFRVVGIGIASGAPAPSALPGATYTADFGTGRPRSRSAERRSLLRRARRAGR